MSAELEHTCDGANHRSRMHDEPKNCLCESCFEEALNAEYEKGVAEGIREAESKS